MLQNLTNGLFKSTTHRVVNPKDANTPLFHADVCSPTE